MIETINHSTNRYPAFQANGNAARFCMPFALEIVKGDLIYDIGYGKEEWKFPNAVGVDLVDGNEFDAMNLPPEKADAIFSSHLLEHLDHPYDALDIWYENLNTGGTLFMYLPNMETQSYHRPWNNRKHLNFITPAIMRMYFADKGNKWINVFISERDAYDAFTVFANKV